MTGTTPAKYLYRTSDKRRGEMEGLPLLSVSIHRGVIPRSELTDAEPRADDLSNYKLVEAGDVVINRMSAYQGALGIARERGIASPEYIVLKPNDDVDSRYLTYLFKSTWFVSQMTSRLRGIGGTEQGNVRTPRINPEDLGGIAVPLPAYGHQTVVADYLDAETARIDALVEKKQRMLNLLDERFMALIDDVSQSLPLQCPIKRVAAIAYGLGQPPELADAGVPIIRATNIDRGAITTTDLVFAAHDDLPWDRCPPLREGEILVVRSGALTGDSAIVTPEWAGAAPGYDLRITPHSIDPAAFGV